VRKELKVVTALLRIPDVQKLLQASRSTVYRLVDCGELERVHLGSSARIIDDSVYAFIEKLRNESVDLVNGAKQ
jgi:excisionase family DNA binding protein